MGGRFRMGRACTRLLLPRSRHMHQSRPRLHGKAYLRAESCCSTLWAAGSASVMAMVSSSPSSCMRGGGVAEAVNGESGGKRTPRLPELLRPGCFPLPDMAATAQRQQALTQSSQLMTRSGVLIPRLHCGKVLQLQQKPVVPLQEHGAVPLMRIRSSCEIAAATACS